MKEINIRRSVRTFSEKQIDKNDIELLLKAAMQAPSAGNQQPWEFVVIQGEDRLKELSGISPYAKPLSNANVCIVVLGNKNIARFPENIEQELGAVCQNMLLEATHLGIGSLWTSVSPLEDRMSFLTNLLNLQEFHIPYAVLAFGYPQKEGAIKFVDRYKEERVFYSSYKKSGDQ